MNRRIPAHVADECANVRLTIPEYALVRRAAHLAGCTIGGYIRSVVLPHVLTLAARRLPQWLPEDHVYATPPKRVRVRGRHARRKKAEAGA